MIKLLQGDCLELMKDIPDGSIDLVVTDPPYKFENQGGGFYAKYASTRRTYLNDLKNINCCEFDPILFFKYLKTKIKKVLWLFFSVINHY